MFAYSIYSTGAQLLARRLHALHLQRHAAGRERHQWESGGQVRRGAAEDGGAEQPSEKGTAAFLYSL